jgi:DNA polymerase-3 subunit delta'
MSSGAAMSNSAVSNKASGSHAVRAMTQWSDLIGHDRVRDWFAAAIRRGRLGGSFLMVGSPGIGKRTLAGLLARTLLCEVSDPQQMAPCGVCQACIQVEAGTHPDVLRVGKPPDKSTIPLERLIGSEGARMKEGFCYELRLRPMRGTRRVAILEDADHLNKEGANCLLKTLEEPPSSVVVLLIGTSEQRQLPTIRSRCQLIRMGPLSLQDATRLLRDVHHVAAGEAEIQQAIEISGGDLCVALRLLQQQATALRRSLTAQLSAGSPDPLVLSKIIRDHVENAGKESSVRRGAMRDAFSIAVQHYRHQLRQQAFASAPQAITLSRLERSVRALGEVDRNANQSTLIECFAVDIAAGSSGDRSLFESE